jgi:hypothetical protein
MLKACQQYDLAERLAKYRFLGAPSSGSSSVMNKRILSNQKGNVHQSWLTKALSVFGKKDSLSFFHSSQVYYRVQLELRKGVSYFLHRLESKFGYFLPYSLSEMRNDEFFHAIQRLTGEEDIKAALVIGAAIGEGSTEAFVTGIQENPNKPFVFCISASKRRFVQLQRAFGKERSVKCYGISALSREQFAKKLEQTVQKIKEENQIEIFDAVLIDSSELQCEMPVNAKLNEKLYGARFVFLDDINAFCNYENHGRLLTDPEYVLVAQNPGLRNGYAIFKLDASGGLALGRGQVCR